MNKFSFGLYLILLILISKSLLSQSDNYLQSSMVNFEYYSFRSLDSCINIQKEIELKPQSKPQILVNLKMKADILFIKGEYKIASEIYDSIIRINQDSTSLLLSEIYRDKGVTLSIINQADSAIKYLLKSLNIAKTFNSNNQLIKIKTSIAEYFRRIHRLDLCYNYLQEAEALIDETVDNDNLIYLLNRYAAYYSQSGNKQQSLKYSQKALSEAISANNLHFMAISYNEIAFLHQKDSSNYAKELLKKSLAIWKSIGYTRYYATALVNIARQAEILGMHKQAILYLDSLQNIIFNKDWKNIELEIVRQKKRIYQKTGEFEKALNYSQRSEEISRDLLIERLDTKIDLINRKYKISEKEAELEAQRKLNNEIKKRNLTYLFIALLLFSLLLLLILAYSKLIHNRNKLNKVNDKLRKSNLALNQTIEEKAELVKEIHHRVNNNLSILSGLVQLQKSNIKDQNALKILNECQDRIGVISQVHKHLQDSSEKPIIQIASFFKTLLSDLEISFGNLVQKLHLSIKSENEEMNLKQAIPLALIVNELFTNSIKHANPENNELIIKCSISVINNELRLAYNDNGVGIKNLESINNPSTTGLKLINLFCKQLNANLNYKYSGGSSFQIQFKLI